MLSADVGLCNLRRCIAFHVKQRCPESDKQVDFSLDAIRGLGERLEQRKSLTEMGNRFDMSGALAGSLPSVIPIVHRLLREPCLGIVMRDKFWLCLSRR